MFDYLKFKAIIEKKIGVTASILVFPFLFVLGLQGFDVCDEGWYLTSYQQIFNAPQTVEYNFAFWLTTIIGGIWYSLFPNGGILSFRVLGALCLIATLFFSNKVLKKYTSKTIIVLALAMVLMVNDYGYLAFYYNLISGLLAVIIVFLLDKGLKNNNLIVLAFAGCITAINVFARLPNVTLFAFLLIFPLQKLWTKELAHSYWIKQTSFFILGATLGFLVIFCIIYLLGHLEIMKSMIEILFNKGTNSDSNHKLSRLVLVYRDQYITVIKVGIKTVILSLPIVFVFNYFKINKFISVLLIIISIIAFSFHFRYEAIFILYFLSILGTIGILFLPYFKSEIKNLAFLAFIVLFFLPLGSDGGIYNAGYVCIWLAFPLFFVFCSKLKHVKPLSVLKTSTAFLTKHSRGFEYLGIAIVFGFLIIKINNISKEAYFDKGSRLEKVHTINNELTLGTYTTKKRAAITNEVLLELKKHVKENDYLLAYDNIPMLNYLTKTKPYMYISWVWVYDSRTFKKQLLRAERETKILPVVVQQKFNTIVTFSEPLLDYMSESKEESYIYKQGRVKAMNSFLKRNKYKIVWSNTHFNILKPKF